MEQDLIESEFSKLKNEDFEKSILGGIILDNSGLEKIIDIISADDFYSDANKIIFSRISKIIQHNSAVDFLLLCEELEKTKELDAVGGRVYVHSLTAESPSTLNIVHYAKIVREYSLKRSLFKIGFEIMDTCRNGHTADELLTQGLKSFERIKNSISGGFVELELWRTLDMAFVYDWQVEPLEWLIENVVARGNLTLVVAASQTGKTLVMLHIARILTTKGQLFGKLNTVPVRKICYFVLEDPDRRIADRGVDDHSDLPEPDRFIVKIAPGLNLSDDSTFKYFENLIQHQSFDVLVIDTYQRATPGITSFDDQKQSVIWHSLSNLTRKYNVTIFIIEHVRKSDTGKRRKHLTLDDVKGTGAKVQNADSVILLDRVSDNEIRWYSTAKDGKPLSFLLKVATEGSNEPKFQFIKDLTADAAHKEHEAQKNKIVEYARNHTAVTSTEISKILKCSAATARRYLNNLVADEVLHCSGENKNRRYFINQSTGNTA